jgi:RsiW-degrading membrane proteinase PrsW (M82 family)
MTMIAEASRVSPALIVLLVVAVVIPIWALVDAISRPGAAFKAAKSSKALWITLVVVTWLLTGFIGLVLSIVYLTSIRPRVKAVTSGR